MKRMFEQLLPLPHPKNLPSLYTRTDTRQTQVSFRKHIYIEKLFAAFHYKWQLWSSNLNHHIVYSRMAVSDVSPQAWLSVKRRSKSKCRRGMKSGVVSKSKMKHIVYNHIDEEHTHTEFVVSKKRAVRVLMAFYIFAHLSLLRVHVCVVCVCIYVVNGLQRTK